MITKIKERLRVCRTFRLRRVIDGAAVPHAMPGRRVTVTAPHPDDEQGIQNVKLTEVSGKPGVGAKLISDE